MKKIQRTALLAGIWGGATVFIVSGTIAFGAVVFMAKCFLKYDSLYPELL